MTTRRKKNHADVHSMNSVNLFIFAAIYFCILLFIKQTSIVRKSETPENLTQLVLDISALFNMDASDLLELEWREYESPHDTCAASEDSDQPGHPPSLIRVFAVRMKKAWVLSYPLSTQRRL